MKMLPRKSPVWPLLATLLVLLTNNVVLAQVPDFGGAFIDGAECARRGNWEDAERTKHFRKIQTETETMRRRQAANQNAAQFLDDMNRAANAIVVAYKQGGIVATSKVVAACYAKLAQNGKYCIYLDTAGRYIDHKVTSAMNAPMSNFYNDGSFGFRTARFVKMFARNLSLDEVNTYLKSVWNVIGSLVDRKL